jgi:hypothetical protein
MENREVLFAYIQPDYQSQGLEWMMLTPPKSEAETPCSIYYFYDIFEKYVFDDWFENSDLAFMLAERKFNVQRGDWKSLDEIQKMGIELDVKVLNFVQQINNERKR